MSYSGGTIAYLWDQGVGNWDTGLDWDANVGPTPGNTAPYASLFTSEHVPRPRLQTEAATILQPLADLQVLMAAYPALFDLNNAVGQQLDTVGQWIGVTRNLAVPITGVYFSLDSSTLGLDQGILQGPFDPTTGLVSLPDAQYLVVLQATIALNQWDGSIPGAYAALAPVFGSSGNVILIFDEGSMHMSLGLLGPGLTPILEALFTGGYLNLRPSGVQLDTHYTPGAPGAPYFGLDAETSVISGLDVGAFGVPN